MIMRLAVLAMAALLLLAVPLASPLLADEAAEVRELVQPRIVEVVGLLKSNSVDKAERNRKIIAIADSMFDFELMAKLSLGQTHWSPLSPAQRDEFVRVFVERLQESYLEKLDLYTDEEVVVDEAKPVKSRVYLTTHLVSKTDRKEMIYKFYKGKAGWKVYDVEILGVSVVQTYRSQFDGFLKQGTFAELMVKLKTSGEFSLPTGNEQPPSGTGKKP
jgi:phospholipid transport system substrate-binding protein